MKHATVKYDGYGHIEEVSDSALHFEQENEALQVNATISTDKKVRAYIKAPNNNSTVTDEIMAEDGIYSVVIDGDYMAKGTLYVGFEVYDDNGYAERYEPLKVYIDSFVSLGTDKNDNVYTVTVTVGNVETLDTDQPATVVNVGNKKDMILKFGIPKGEKGDKGDKGEKGDIGEQGIQGIQGVPGADGYTPIKGTDYFTDEEFEKITAEAAEEAEQRVRDMVIDSELSSESSNPVQNKTVKEALNNYANALEGSESGTNICVEDVSCVEHNVSVQVRSYNALNLGNIAETTKNGITYSVEDNILKIDGTASNSVGIYINIDALCNGTTYTHSVRCNGSSPKIYFSVNNVGTNMILLNTTDDLKSKSFIPDYESFRYQIWIDKGSVFDNCEYYLQIERGTEVTDFIPYTDVSSVEVNVYGADETENMQTYISDTDGVLAGVTSISPTMTITTDTEGVYVDLKYNRDTNKVIEKLVDAIVSLGGNV